MPTRSVRDFITSDALLKAGPEESVREAAIAMAAHHSGAVLVCRDDTLIGIFTERDLVAKVAALGLSLETPLIEVMTANPDSIAASVTIAEAIAQMKALGCRHLPVVQAGRLLGMLSLRDLAAVETALGLAAVQGQAPALLASSA